MRKMHGSQNIPVSLPILQLCSRALYQQAVAHLSNLSVRTVQIAIRLAAAIWIFVAATLLAQSQTFSVLYNFTGFADGGNPYGGLILDAQGNLYGTTVGGGVSGNGTVFRIDATGTQSVLYSFAGGTDGRSPLGVGLILDGDNLYGTTYYGGTSDNGTVFKVDASTGSETVLYSFTGGADGKWPVGVVLDAGTLYGVTQLGGAYFSGVVYKLSLAGNQTVLYSFNGTAGDGVAPESALTRDSLGNLYGTTAFGGVHGNGSVFKLDKNGTETVLYSFAGGTDGANPNTALVLGADGLYGNTYAGGDAACPNGCGVVFKLTSTGKETLLHRFTGGRDGGSPYFATLIHDTQGNLYGTASVGGDFTCNTPIGCGVVFKVAKAGESVLHRFAGTDGASPYAGLAQDTVGNLYGTTYQGGAFGQGVVFKIGP